MIGSFARKKQRVEKILYKVPIIFKRVSTREICFIVWRLLMIFFNAAKKVL